MADRNGCPGAAFDPAQAGDDPELRQHAAVCDGCGGQQVAEAALREAFAAMSRPEPSLGFDMRLRAALAAERQRRLVLRRSLRLMRAYWLLSGLVCAGILGRLPWSEAPAGAWLPLLILSTIVVLPLLLARVDLVELVIGSYETLLSFTTDDPTQVRSPSLSTKSE